MAACNWPALRIGDLGDVFTGRTPPTERSSYFGKEFPFITPGDMHQGMYARETQRSLSHEGAELLNRIKLPANSVCVSCIGWQMGEVVMTDRPSFTNQQINTIVPNSQVDASFLYYSLRTRKQELLSLGSATGVRTPILNKSAFCDTKVVVPPLPVQQRIAGILSAYDELIENSQRRIKILESMARALYREWFVHFRFPGHENHPRVASPLGEIPQGWEVKTVKEILARRPAGSVYRDADVKPEGDVPVIDQSTNELLGFQRTRPQCVFSVANGDLWRPHVQDAASDRAIFCWSKRRPLRGKPRDADCLRLLRGEQSCSYAGIQTPLDTAHCQRGGCR